MIKILLPNRKIGSNTTYASLQPDPPVLAGDSVSAGAVIGTGIFLIKILLPNRKIGSNRCHVLRLPPLAAAGKTACIKCVISEFFHKTAICGTDVHIYNWDPWAQEHIKPPMVIGHEYVGEVR